MKAAALMRDLRTFQWEGRATVETTTSTVIDSARTLEVPTFINEFWTSKQRDAHSLHEVSYRACFKPQLPRFFIDRLTKIGDVVYDPFAGRGTTPLEAALAGRLVVANDINPLTAILLAPRLAPPSIELVGERLSGIDLTHAGGGPADLLTFYHPETLREICALREYLLARERTGSLDTVDRWIRMVAVNRLTGHSPGFFSVYTLPPNQATSVVAQRKINTARQQEPPRRDVVAIIVKKSRALVKDIPQELSGGLFAPGDKPARGPVGSPPYPLLLTGPAHQTPGIPDDSIDLVVTSPPFLDTVQYATDNWLRCWFCGIDAKKVPITMSRRLDDWRAVMTQVFHELHRVLKPGGFIAFEVGEVRGGALRLEHAVVEAGTAAVLDPVLVLINAQQFTKTANVWGVANNRLGTNTNRIVVFQKPRSAPASQRRG
jgi:DNA modification methylase